jgi:TctA family transporter
MFLSLGMGIGLVFGALPGLGGATALALLMPLTTGSSRSARSHSRAA